MGAVVSTTESPAQVLDVAGSYLRGDPVRHSLILTILETRVAHPEPGRYWIASVGGRVEGVALQSPLHYFATITPMARETATAIVDAIVDQGVALPGVHGEPATAAVFAGHWTERTRSAARPVEGQRIYELEHVIPPARSNGRLRPATGSDRAVLVEWFEGFQADTGDLAGHAAADYVDRRLAAGQLWIWDDSVPVAMGGLTDPIADVVRVGPVFTPLHRRRRGYASGLVAALSARVDAREQRCILYTQLDNSSSNAIYRAIGYRAVAEALRYDFQSTSAPLRT